MTTEISPQITSHDLNIFLRAHGKACLSNTTPAPPSGAQNITWQTDAAGTLSAYVTSSDTSSGQGTVVYDRSYWADLSDFRLSPTVPTPTLVNGSVQFTASNTGTFSNWLSLPVTANDDDDIDIELTVTCGAGTYGQAGSSAYGFDLGKVGIGPYNTWGLIAHYDTYNAKNGVQLYYVANNGGEGNFTAIGSEVSGPTGFTCAVGDVIKLVYSQRGSNFSVFATDETQGVSISSNFQVAYTPAGSGSPIPNTTEVAIFNEGGTFYINRIRVISRKVQSPVLAIVGDSKTYGLDAGSRNLRYGSLLNGSIGPAAVYAGSGDGTQSVLYDLPYILASKPQTILLNIGRNDLASSVPSATWQANYSEIVSQILVAGVSLVHLLPIPETTQDQTALYDYITTTFAGQNMIDPSVGWNMSAYLATDNIHPNTAGHVFLANLIRNSGLFPESARLADFTPVTSDSLYEA